MESRKQRIVGNQVLFRAGNERLYSWPEEQQKAMRGEPLVFWCECATGGCRARIRLTAFEYEAVRMDPMRFIVLREHVFPEAERIVEDHGDYVVVEKNEEARDLVEKTDPRGGGNR